MTRLLLVSPAIGVVVGLVVVDFHGLHQVVTPFLFALAYLSSQTIVRSPL